jgi:hypothetical protein
LKKSPGAEIAQGFLSALLSQPAVKTRSRADLPAD